ncbi:MAG: glycosyltransferase [Culicoidibacterales bacterium]
MKKIFVNNTAATSGGALSILKQFLKEVASVDVQNQYYIFCNTDLSEFNELSNIKIINLKQPKSMKVRLKWDYIDMKKWAKIQGITPDVIISLQNTAVYGFKNVPQIIYLHQPLPFYFEYKWSFRKNKQLWFYKNIYKWLIIFGSKNNTIIVQANWFSTRVKKVLKHAKEIVVLKPTGADIDISQYDVNLRRSEKLSLFYPTSPVFYKNYHVLIEAMKSLEGRNIELLLTLDKEQLEHVNADTLPDNIVFLGALSHFETIKQMSQVDILVFPSYIETFGLPLLEAAALGKQIFAADLEYSKEILEGYSNVQYINPTDEKAWANAIFHAEKGIMVEPFRYQSEWGKFVEIINNM